MFYKVIKENQIVDWFAHYPQYVRFEERSQMLVNSTARESMGIVSSDGRYVWYALGCHPFPSYYKHNGEVQLLRIEEEEYLRLEEKENGE